MYGKDSIDDEKVSRQKQFDRFCYYLGGVKQGQDTDEIGPQLAGDVR